jgi:HEAT repeat protein
MFIKAVITGLLITSTAVNAVDEEKIWKYLESENQTLGIKGLDATVELSDEEALPFLLYAVEAPRPKVAKKAGELLAERRIPEAFDELVPMLDTDNEDTYGAVSTALMAYPPDDFFNEVQPLLKDGSAGKRLFAVKYVGEYGGKKKVKLLKDALSDPEESVKHAAVVALKDEDIDIIPAALELFDSETTQVVVDAVEAISDKKDPRAFEPLIGLLNHKFANVGVPAAEALSKYEGDEYVDRFIELSTGEDERLRAFALKRMAASGEERVIPYLMDRLADDKVNVVISAINGLYELNYTDAGDRFKDILMDVDYADEIRFAAMRALAEMGIEGSDVLIARLMNSESEAGIIRQNAAIALSYFKNDFAFETLYEVVADGDVNSRMTAAAVRGLGLLGDSRAIPLLIGLTEDRSNHPVIYAPAVIAISYIGGAEAYEFLYREYITKDMEDSGYSSIIPYALATCGDDRGPRMVMNDLERVYENPDIGSEDDKSVSFRRAAITGLADSGLGEAKEVVVTALGDPDESVRTVAVEAAGKVFDPDMIPILENDEELNTGKLKFYTEKAVNTIKERYAASEE